MRFKSVEIAWRTAWMRAIAATLPGPCAAAAPEWGSRPFRVLYVRYEAIGDLIMATGVIRAIVRSHPTITLDVLASRRNHEALAQNPHVGRVLHFDVRAKGGYPAVIRELAAARYDVIVDGRVDHARVFTTTPLLMRAAGAPLRVGAAGEYGRLVYNLPVPLLPRTVHYVERTAYLAEPFGVDRAATSWAPELFLSAAERGAAEARWGARGDAARAPRVLVNLSASSAARRWPDDRFVALLRHVRGRLAGARVLVLSVPEELEAARAVAAAGGGEAAHTPSVRSALALTGTADFVITPDTSISHAAAAFDVPATVLISSARTYHAPYYARAELALYDGDDITALAVAGAAAAVDAMLAAPRRHC